MKGIKMAQFRYRNKVLTSGQTLNEEAITNLGLMILRGINILEESAIEMMQNSLGSYPNAILQKNSDFAGIVLETGKTYAKILVHRKKCQYILFVLQN